MFGETRKPKDFEDVEESCKEKKTRRTSSDTLTFLLEKIDREMKKQRRRKRKWKERKCKQDDLIWKKEKEHPIMYIHNKINYFNSSSRFWLFYFRTNKYLIYYCQVFPIYTPKNMLILFRYMKRNSTGQEWVNETLKAPCCDCGWVNDNIFFLTSYSNIFSLLFFVSFLFEPFLCQMRVIAIIIKVYTWIWVFSKRNGKYFIAFGILLRKFTDLR